MKASSPAGGPARDFRPGPLQGVGVIDLTRAIAGPFCGLLLGDLGSSGRDVRIETGMREGDTVTPYYDSLLAKIVVRGEDRAAAIGALAERLAQTRVGGVKSNLQLLQRIVAHPAFAGGEVDTTFIERHSATLLGPSA